MCDIYVARQPIFDSQMHLYGYELLYRRSARNMYEGDDDDQATASLFTDTFFMGYDELIDNTRGFINFSEKLLFEGVPTLLPKDRLVVEVLERVAITDEVIEVCRELKRKGYTLALDDFVFSDEYAPLIKIADIIKIEFPRMPKEEQAALLNKYRSRITFLAEKVETFEEYRQAVKAGYKLFQGYFFSRPIMINAKEIGTLNNNMVLISKKLSEPDPDFKAIASIIERDVELSYKLLRIANSAYYGVRMQVTSIHHALVTLGVQDLLRWGHLILLKGLNNTDNAELVKTSLIRARMLSQFALVSRRPAQESDYFLTGLFSSIDALLHQSMEQVMSRLPLTDAVKGALLGENSDMHRALVVVQCFERGDWVCTDDFLSETGLSTDTFMALYYEALRWQHSLDV
jgi:c-di-GMP-related signal transduction protein